MLVIKPIQEKEFQKEVCKLCGFDFKPLSFSYSEFNDDKLIASCQFDISGKDSVILDFGMVKNTEEDIEALIILGRAVLNFLELSGAKRTTFTITSPLSEKYAKMIGFKFADNTYTIELEGLFDGKCSHCK